MLGASFQDKLFNFQFFAIQLGKSFFKFKCSQTRNSHKTQSYWIWLWCCALLKVWRSQVLTSMDYRKQGSSSCCACFLRTREKQKDLQCLDVRRLRFKCGLWIWGRKFYQFLRILREGCNVFSFEKLLLKECTAYKQWHWGSRIWDTSGASILILQLSFHSPLEIFYSFSLSA